MILILVYSQTRRGSHVIVIHPGSRYLRIGRASELSPVYVPNVVARKAKAPVPPVLFEESIMRPRKDRTRSTFTKINTKNDEYSVMPGTDDPVRILSRWVTIFTNLNSISLTQSSLACRGLCSQGCPSSSSGYQQMPPRRLPLSTGP